MLQRSLRCPVNKSISLRRPEPTWSRGAAGASKTDGKELILQCFRGTVLTFLDVGTEFVVINCHLRCFSFLTYLRCSY